MRYRVKKHEEPLYEKLAGLLEEMILSRSLRPGDRVPSVRQFSRQQRASVPTVLQAFATLETRGLVEARPKSGFYVRARRADLVREPSGPDVVSRVTHLAESDPFDSIIHDHANPRLAHLGAAQPCPELLPGEKLARILGVLARKLGSQSVCYDMPPGSEALRRELACRSLEWGCSLKPEDFLVTTGCTEAVALALQATCKPGDTVAVESPTYHGLVCTLRELRLNALPIPADSARGLDLDALESALRRKKVAACSFIPNFNNPTGSLIPDENKRRLVEMLAMRGIPVIEDDLYGDLQHTGPRPRCLKAFDKDGTVLLCGSFSKTLAPGFRVGYLSAGRWQARVLRLKTTTSLASAGLPGLAIAEFLKTGGYDRHLRTLRQAYREQVARMREAIVEAFPEGIGLSRPQGGFVLWCELPKEVDSMDLFKKARAAGVVIAPGPLFSPQGGCRNFIRLNCGYPWSTRTERSLEILGRLLKELSGPQTRDQSRK
jgi:DNA-binding transcriptional MocR family regulator